MNLASITQLIEIRNYVSNAIHNYNLNKDTSRTMSKMLTLLDKRITDTLLSPAFKTFINFEDADKAMQDAIKNNDIKSGMTPSDKMVVIKPK